MGKTKLLIIISAIVVFCFVPLMDMPYEVMVQKQVLEEYTTVEPYTVIEEVREAYTTTGEIAEWHDGGLSEFKSRIYSTPEETLDAFSKVAPGYYTIRQYPVTKYRTVEKPVTKYSEVTKTRMVYRPVVETRTKRVSMLRYLLR